MESIQTPNFTTKIKNIKQYNNLLEIEFSELTNLLTVDLSSIDILTSGGIKCTSTPLVNYTTIYKTDGNTITLSNDGSIYVEPEQIESNPIIGEPYNPTPEDLLLQLESSKKNKVIESKSKLDIFLENNPYLFIDDKHYSVTKEKQNLLSNAIAVYQMKLQSGDTNATIKWNATGEECTIRTIEEVIVLALSIATYVEPLVAQQQSFEVKINSCETQAELDGIVINYENAM